ncbi:ArnT family glycosyltransferase [Maricaulis sp.]|uniref:ArnT family glycosyltransferase n=1 Tax=Maricaulis sp. TaxID=1486257 RepID=UPI002B26DD1B|nr:glycosyltransferase family 39 protein [Maricaulis sp.]
MPESPTASPLSRDTWTRAAIALIIGFAVLRIIALAISPVSLYQDESQYWVWSRHFDWGYYSKPPMIAWLISLSTGLLGDSDFAIRLPATLLHTGTAIFLMLSARQLWDERSGFWAAALYLTMPAIWVSGVVISTDAVLFLAWSGGLYALLRLRADGGWGAAAGLGLALGFGFLSKYAMIYFLVSTALAIVFDAPARRALLGLRGAATLAIFLALLAPNLAWNAAHDFATVTHTAANANWGGELFHPGELFEFLIAQPGVFGPVTFGVLVTLFGLTLGKFLRAAPDQRLLVLYALPPLAVVAVQAFISRAHANWAAATYVAGTLLVVGFLLRGATWRRWALFGSIGLHTVIGLTIITLAASPALVVAVGAENATKRIRAWDVTAEQIIAAAEADDYAMIVFDDRNAFHQMQRYAPQLEGRMAMWLRFAGPSNHAEDVWPLSEGQAGRLLVISNRPREVPRMREDFDVFEPVGRLAIPLDGTYTRDFTLWQAEGYQRVERDEAYEIRWQAHDEADRTTPLRGYSGEGR